MSDWILPSLAVLVGVYLLLVAALIVAGERGAARAVAGFVPDCVVLLKRLLGDPRVPRLSKAVLVGVIGYLAMPIDLVPDFIPVAGQLDDAIVVALAIRLVLRASGPGLVRELWPGPEHALRVILRLATPRPARGSR